MESAVRSGYLSYDRGFQRYYRSDGPRYSEMVEFVKRFEASEDLRFLLDDICDEIGCAHIIG